MPSAFTIEAATLAELRDDAGFWQLVQPPVDGHTLVPMRLMFRPALGQELPAGAATENLIRAIYFEKYHAINKIPSSTLERLARSGSAAVRRARGQSRS